MNKQLKFARYFWWSEAQDLSKNIFTLRPLN